MSDTSQDEQQDKHQDQHQDDQHQDDPAAVDDAASRWPGWRGWGRRLPLVLALLLVAGLAAYVVRLGLDLRTEGDVPSSGVAAVFRDDRADDAVQVAEAQVLGLTTLDFEGIDPQLDTLMGRTTGDFRRQFQGMLSTFSKVVQDGRITAQGEIVASGLSNVDGTKATALVASIATVTNTQQDKPTPRNYRMRVTLQYADGAWLVSGMEFV